MPRSSPFSNLASMFEQSSRRFADRPLLGSKRDGAWRWLSYAEVGAQVARLRGGLAGLGVHAGDRIACVSGNRPEWLVAAYATYGLGATFVPLFEALRPDEMRFILADAGARVVLVAGTAREKVQAVAKELPDLEHIVDLDGEGYTRLLEAGARTPAAVAEPSGSDIALLCYTSGTTGTPKGVRLRHHGLAANVSAAREVLPFEQNDRTLAFLPWAHVFGGSVELGSCLSIGASFGICESADRLLDNLAEVRPTILYAVPRIWNRIHDTVRAQMAAKPAPIRHLFEAGIAAQDRRRHGEPTSARAQVALTLARALIFRKIVAKLGGRLKYACSGGAALAPEVGELIANLGLTVYEGYGMTEASGIIACNSPAAHRIGSVGKPLPGIEVRLDRTAPGSDGDSGEIVVHGHAVFGGYHNQADATRAALTDEGGLRTGDLGRFDADGFLHITGRCKELYKLENGRYVAPTPLEERLTLSPFIAQAFVYGDNRPHNVALIVPDAAALERWAAARGLAPDGLLGNPAVHDLIAGELEKSSADLKSFERVRNFALLPEALTPENDLLTPTLKIKRRNVVARYRDELERLYA
jgi:long-chain acyl-CoA synthetase